MTIGERSIGDVTIVDINGRIAVQDGVDDLRSMTRELIRQNRVKIVFNLHGVPYIDSTALGEIIRTYTSVIRKGGSVKLLDVNTHVHQLLMITQLLTVFDLFESEDDAVRSFGTPR